jgi:hypothetical protein
MKVVATMTACMVHTRWLLWLQALFTPVFEASAAGGVNAAAAPRNKTCFVDCIKHHML